jgi:hypothetical protein
MTSGIVWIWLKPLILKTHSTLAKPKVASWDFFFISFKVQTKWPTCLCGKKSSELKSWYLLIQNTKFVKGLTPVYPCSGRVGRKDVVYVSDRTSSSKDKEVGEINHLRTRQSIYWDSKLLASLMYVPYSFLSWLAWGRNQVYCACCSAQTVHKLVETGSAK